MPTHTEKNPKDTAESPHATISFTAHYTGEMWQKLGLSHPALATSKGKRMHRFFAPVDWFAKTFFGVTLGKTLTVRHALIDNRISAFVEKHPQAQIVEIAAGLSPRGWRYLQQYPDIHYAEIDLPAMSALKKERAKNLPEPVPAFFAADVFSSQLDDAFATLDKTKPVLIVTEGLINYFSLDMLAQLSQILSHKLKDFPDGQWITENYPYSDKPSYNALVKVASSVLRVLSRSDFNFYFNTPQDALHFFTQNGFTQGNIYQPSQSKVEPMFTSNGSGDKAADVNAQQPENSKHLGDTVWVIELH